MDHKYLAKIQLFQKLPESELNLLAEKMQVVETQPGEILFNEGDQGDYFYVITEGELDVIKALGTQNERTIATRKQGTFIGELSLINPAGKRMATVRSKTGAVLWQLARSDFEEVLHNNSNIAYKILQELSQRLTTAHEKTIVDLQEKNRELFSAYQELQAAQEQIIEKEKLERELFVAHNIQQSILPDSVPETETFRFSAFLKPARMVGGDFYDIFQIGENKIGIMIGDVTDKGIPAALVMAQTHALLYSEAKWSKSPERVLSQTNEKIMRLNKSGLFVTAIYGILDTDTREFTYARAGHEIPLILYPNKDVQFTPQGTGQPLGIFDDPIFDLQQIHLPEDSRLLLYTDGVLDIRNEDGDQYKIDGLVADLTAHSLDFSKNISDSIYDHLSQFQGDADQYDDITMIGIHSLNSND